MTRPDVEFTVHLETLTFFTPLGIRFWDASTDVAVDDGLTVTAWPVAAPHLTIGALRTASGVYAFHGLPGLRHVEYPSDAEEGTSLPSPHPFVVAVADRLRRFLPAAFVVSAPYQGIFPTAPGSLPGSQPPGVSLFSAPTRRVGPGMAVVRAQLLDVESREPAAYAVLEVDTPGRDHQTWFGLADDRGRAAVVFPYPVFTDRLEGSLPTSAALAGEPQRWPIGVRVRYQPSQRRSLPGAELPDLFSVFQQRAGVIWPTRLTPAAGPAVVLPAELAFGQEVVLRTDAGSTLVVAAAASQP